jgi:succinyl-CoA synthetase alpha subunit
MGHASTIISGNSGMVAAKRVAMLSGGVHVCESRGT